MKRALLVSMPFATTASPSLGLSLLKASLVREGLPCDLHYLNLLFARRIGVTAYERISNFSPDVLLGDWLFAASLFGDQVPPPARYFAEVLHRCAFLPFEHERAEGYSPERDGEILEIRAQVAAYLDECLASVPWEDYALVGFTSTFQQNVATLALARRLKERYPHLVVVLGGANCEGEMGLAIHRLFPFVDYVCSGEGDLVFPRLARHVLEGQTPGELPGIISRAAGRTVGSAASVPVMDLDSLPVPDYSDFIAQRSILGAEAIPDWHLPLETARGCWWGEKSHCTFCGLNGATLRFRAKSAERALAELAALVEQYQPPRVAAVDNILDLGYFRDVLPRLAEMQLGVELFYETKANLRKEQIRLLREAGISRIQPGIESLSTNVLRRMRKGVSALQNIQLLRWCSEYMVQPYWSLLAGFPGEDPADYARQAELAPLLTHLPPPIDVAPVRLDRFSPLFVNKEHNGICNVHAAHAYRYVYPFPEQDLDRLAYYFDFEYADGRAPVSYIGELRRQVEVWANPANQCQLVALVEGDALVVRDTRLVAVQKEHRLTGLQRALYEYCDQARTRAEIDRHLALLTADESAAAAAVDEALGALLTAKLLLHEDGRYLSLAVWGGYQVDFVTQQLGLALGLLPEPAAASG